MWLACDRKVKSYSSSAKTIWSKLNEKRAKEKVALTGGRGRRESQDSRLIFQFFESRKWWHSGRANTSKKTGCWFESHRFLDFCAFCFYSLFPCVLHQVTCENETFPFFLEIFCSVCDTTRFKDSRYRKN